MNDISYWVAFLSGFLYFFSPCVLPLIPSYLSFISGVSFQELKSRPQSARGKVVLNTLIFFSGFSFIFISFGLGASAVGDYVFKFKLPLEIIGGVIVTFLGGYLLFQGKIKIFLNSKSFIPRLKPAGFLGTFLIGAAFAFSWTACATPILTAILITAGLKATLFKGFLLLLFFSLGLGIPFIASALSLALFLTVFEKLHKNIKVFEILAGVILIVYGLYMLLGRYL